MIHVAFFRREGRLIGFESEGHAGYAEYGSDIVCAAVSALLVSAVNSLDCVAGVHPSVRQNDEIGYLKAELPGQLTEEALHDAGIILASAECGLQGIAEQYPGYVRVISKNRR